MYHLTIQVTLLVCSKNWLHL